MRVNSPESGNETGGMVSHDAGGPGRGQVTGWSRLLLLLHSHDESLQDWEQESYKIRFALRKIPPAISELMYENKNVHKARLSGLLSTKNQCYAGIVSNPMLKRPGQVSLCPPTGCWSGPHWEEVIVTGALFLH